MIKLTIILAIVGCCTLGCVDGNQRKDQVGETIVGQSVARAKDGVCMDNLKQIRGMMEAASSGDESAMPASLNDLKVPQEMQSCPIGHEPYIYTPNPPSVKCKHLGHEKY
jgi:hypothetical protein